MVTPARAPAEPHRRDCHMGTYQDAYDASIKDPDAFWGEQARLVDWFVRPKTILDRSDPPLYRWFSDGRLNTCYNALDRHVINGRADQTALIYDSAVADSKQQFTYAQLLERVAAFAG